MNNYQKEILSKLRELYGNNFQLMVCIEELNELACVLCKYPRYDDPEKAITELSGKVLDEYTDVDIILEHVKNIFRLTDEEIERHREAKIDRVKRWVDSGNQTPQQTLVDREVKD
jgi:hypothetical protein